ncbi:MAG TPA: hypothetical protein PKI20_17660 [Verrucomicrobiota bacterium]|nr:hypothetical protein [Verrucomicrobiota bacterium]
MPTCGAADRSPPVVALWRKHDSIGQGVPDNYGLTNEVIRRRDRNAWVCGPHRPA